MPDKDAMRLGGLILTGGRSQRMGRAKESLPIGDTTMLARQCKTLLRCTDPVLVVARDRDQALPELPDNVDVVLDESPGRGPLAAIATGLRHLAHHHHLGPADAAFVTGCDLPFLAERDVYWLREQLVDADVVMTRTGGRLQPLASILRLRCLTRADELLAAGTQTPRSLAEGSQSHVVTEQMVREHDPELRFLRNINAPEDYQAAQRELGTP